MKSMRFIFKIFFYMYIMKKLRKIALYTRYFINMFRPVKHQTSYKYLFLKDIIITSKEQCATKI